MTFRRKLALMWDTWLCLAALAACNLPLVLSSHPNVALVLFPEAVRAGEWWRLVFHPFVHVSLYHLALDGLAFVLLLRSLDMIGPLARLTIATAAAATSAITAAVVGSELPLHGLCGLSGAAHGLMAASGLLMLRHGNDSDRRTGRWLIGLVSLKALFEAASGQVLFEALHFGRLGLPNAYCHLGGVLGGLLVAALVGSRCTAASRTHATRSTVLTGAPAGESAAVATRPFRPAARVHPGAPGR